MAFERAALLELLGLFLFINTLYNQTAKLPSIEIIAIRLLHLLESSIFNTSLYPFWLFLGINDRVFVQEVSPAETALKIFNVQPQDSGTYVCVVGKQFNFINITVQSKLKNKYLLLGMSKWDQTLCIPWPVFYALSKKLYNYSFHRLCVYKAVRTCLAPQWSLFLMLLIFHAYHFLKRLCRHFVFIIVCYGGFCGHCQKKNIQCFNQLCLKNAYFFHCRKKEVI